MGYSSIFNDPPTDYGALVGGLCYSFRHWNVGADGAFTFANVLAKCTDWGENGSLGKIETSAQQGAVAEARSHWQVATACMRVGAKPVGGTVWKWTSDESLVKHPPVVGSGPCSCWRGSASLKRAPCDDTFRPWRAQYVCSKPTTTTTTTSTTTSTPTIITTTTTTTTTLFCIHHDYGGGAPFRAEINVDFADFDFSGSTTIALPLPWE